MTTLILRGGFKTINLSTMGNGNYTLAAYGMGTPGGENASDSPNLAVITAETVVDTLTLHIVAGTRADLSRVTGDLYRVLSEASDYWRGEYHKPVYLGVQVEGQSGEVYATVVDFSFHELPDISDAANGHFLQEATLILTRTLWSTLPPQTLPYSLVNPETGADLDEATYLLKPTIVTTGGFHNGQSINYAPVTALHDENVVLTNGYRYGGINTIFTNNGLTTDPYGSDKQTSNVFEGNYLFTPEAGTVLYAWFGSTGTYAHRFTGLVFDNAQAITDLTDPTFWVWTGAAWTQLTVASFIAKFNKEGDRIVSWSTTSAVFENWVKNTVNSVEGYWVQMRATSAGGFDLFYNVGYEQRKNIYQPHLPYVDVTPPDGDVDVAVRYAFKCWNPRKHTDAQTAAELAEDHGVMTRLAVASVPHTLGPTVFGGTPLPSGGFLPFDTRNGELQIVLYEGAGKTDNDDLVGATYAPQHVQIDLGDVSADALSKAQLGQYFPLVAASFRFPPGPYRVFMRYNVVPKLADATVYLRLLSTSRYLSYETTKEYATKVHTFRTDNAYHDQNYVNVADFGVVWLTPKTLKPGHDYTSNIIVQGKAVVDGSALGTDAVLNLYDLILLPVNDRFMIYDMSRSPRALNKGYTDDRVAPWDANQEGFFIDGFAPDGPAGSVMITPPTWSSSDTLTDGTRYNPVVQEPAVQLGLGRSTLKPGVAQRIYFFWYKVAPDGTLLSSFDINYSVRIYAARQFVTLPAV